MFLPEKELAAVNRQRLKQSIAQSETAVENGDDGRCFMNKFPIEKDEHEEVLTQRCQDAEKNFRGATVLKTSRSAFSTLYLWWSAVELARLAPEFAWAHELAIC